MKVDILGKGHAYNLAEMLNNYGVMADCNSQDYEDYDIIFGCGLWNIPNPTPPNFVVWAMGSDYRMDKLRPPKGVPYLAPSVSMVPSDMRVREWSVWSMPYNTKMFNLGVPGIYDTVDVVMQEKRDVLLYALSPEIYCGNKILEVVGRNPRKTFTLLGGGASNMLSGAFDNLRQIDFVPWHLMPKMYSRHNEFRVWWSHEGCGHASVMNFEAKAMGLRSFWMDKEVTEIPDYMKMEVAIPWLIKYFKGLMESRSLPIA